MAAVAAVAAVAAAAVAAVAPVSAVAAVFHQTDEQMNFVTNCCEISSKFSLDVLTDGSLVFAFYGLVLHTEKLPVARKPISRYLRNDKF